MNMLSLKHVQNLVKPAPQRSAAENAVAPPAKLGLRELNRRDKLARIKAAARDLFTELGFDRATTRDIAKRAHVGLGTLFNYADDKRDLVFLIFNEELDRITDRAFESIDQRAPLEEQLTGAFGVFYRAFAANPMLSRILLQEMTFYSQGRLAGDFQRSKRRTIGFIERLIAAAQREGRLRTAEDPGVIALSVFFLYAGAVRYWIATEKPNPKAGIDDLRRMIRLHLAGISRPARAAAPRRR
jgi:AcrR family transcriptional regulator